MEFLAHRKLIPPSPKPAELNNMEMIVVDGSYLEGGGQIVRLSLCLCSIKQKAARIHSIRKGRSVGGLSAQHLECVKLVADICEFSVRYASLRSTVLEIHPRDPNKILNLRPSYIADCNTAGSISLILQASLPSLIFNSSELSTKDPTSIAVHGGTNVPFSPPIDHTKCVLLPLLSKMGISIDLTIVCRGYYPKGGGHVIATALSPPGNILPLNLIHQGKLISILGLIICNDEAWMLCSADIRSLCSNLKSYLSQHRPNVNIDIRMEHNGTQSSTSSQFESSPGALDPSSSCSAYPDVDRKVRTRDGGRRKQETVHRRHSRSKSSLHLGVQLIGCTDTGCILSTNHALDSSYASQGISIEDAVLNLGIQVADMFLRLLDSGACVDDHTADQLLIYCLACPLQSQLVCGPVTTANSTSSDTSHHLETAAAIINQFEGWDRIRISEVDNGCRLVTCLPVQVSVG